MKEDIHYHRIDLNELNFLKRIFKLLNQLYTNALVQNVNDITSN